MTFTELQSILGNKEKTLTRFDLEKIVFELKNDVSIAADKALSLSAEMKRDFQRKSLLLREHHFLRGERTAYQVVLDLLDHLEDFDSEALGFFSLHFWFKGEVEKALLVDMLIDEFTRERNK